MFSLPENSRHFFKTPFGYLFRNISEAGPVLSGRTVYAVGDVVTHNLVKAGISPSIAIVDGLTMRSPCRKDAPLIGRRIRITNPAGTITDELIDAIREAVAHPPATIDVNGEEDLAVIPLVLEAPAESVVIYGQPKEGVVVRIVDAAAKEKARELFACFIKS